jgi:predicted component of type VI protein secretion system
MALTTNDDVIICDEAEELNRIEIDKVKQMKWCNKTLKTYIQSMAKFFVWLRSVKPRFQEMWNNENGHEKLIDKFRVGSFLIFCNQLSRIDQKTNTKKNLTFAGLSGYRSALTYHLTQIVKLKLCENDEKDLSDYFSGFLNNYV